MTMTTPPSTPDADDWYAPHMDPVAAATGLARRHAAAGDERDAYNWWMIVAQRLEGAGDLAGAVAALEAAASHEQGEVAFGCMERRAHLMSYTDMQAASEAWSAIAQSRADAPADHADAQVCERLARAHYFAFWPGMIDEYRSHLDQAIRLEDQAPGWGARARALAATLDRVVDVALSADTQAIASARASRDVELEALALRSYGSNSFDEGDHEAIELIRHAGLVAESAGFHAWSVESRLTLTDALLTVGRHQDAIVESRALLGYTGRRSLMPWRHLVVAAHVDMLTIRGALTEAVGVLRQEMPDLEQVHNRVPDLGLLSFVQANLALLTGAPTEEVDRLLDAAVEQGADGYDLYSFRVALARMQLRARESGVQVVLADAAGLPAMESHNVAQLALWLARTGLFEQVPDAIALAVDMIDAVDVDDAVGEIAHTSLCCDEIRLIGQTLTDGAGSRTESVPQVHPEAFDVLARRWDRLGLDLDAARCRLGAVMSSSSGGEAQGDADTARRLVGLSDTFAQLGSTIEARFIASMASGQGERVQRLLNGLVSSSALLGDLDAPARRAFLAAGVLIDMPSGRMLFHRGDVPDAMYVIASGGARLATTDDAGRELTLDALGVGDVIGSTRGDDTPADTFAETTDASVLFTIPRSQLASLRARVPGLADQLARHDQSQRARVERLAVELAYASAQQRLARLIRSLDERFGHPTLKGERMINRRITQGELATMIGSSRKSVAVILGELRDLGVLDLDKKRIIIRDQTSLAAIASGEQHVQV